MKRPQNVSNDNKTRVQHKIIIRFFFCCFRLLLGLVLVFVYMVPGEGEFVEFDIKIGTNVDNIGICFCSFLNLYRCVAYLQLCCCCGWCEYKQSRGNKEINIQLKSSYTSLLCLFDLESLVLSSLVMK